MSEFTDAELVSIREMLLQRYRTPIEIHLADSETCIDTDQLASKDYDHANTVSCPTVYWHARGANFVVLKIAPYRYRTQFFYTPHDQFNCGIEEYTDLDECVAAVLQIQADHERQRETDSMEKR